MKILTLINKFRWRWLKFWLQPIRVFCMHHVCEYYDEEVMCSCDWMALSEFKNKIIALQKEGYHFISLTNAYHYLHNEFIRRKKLAVITFDDGYKSLLEVLPWLKEQQIPVTLFINGKYLDGKSYRDTSKERYLTYDELFFLTSPLIEIGHHGWEHTSVHTMSEEDFRESVHLNIDILSKHPHYIPFWSYTWGHHNDTSDSYLMKMNIVPVVITGGKNYLYKGYLDRELL